MSNEIPFYIAGVALIIFGFAKLIYDNYIIKNGILTEATVVGMEITRGRRGMIYHHAILSFNAEGNEYRVVSPSGATIPLHAEGSIVKIHYFKKNPEKIVEHGKAGLLGDSLALGFIAAGVIIILYVAIK